MEVEAGSEGQGSDNEMFDGNPVLDFMDLSDDVADEGEEDDEDLLGK